MKVLSLFDGISCGRLALERTGFSVSRYVACEVDKHAVEVSMSNYPDTEHIGDVFKADFTRFAGFDLLLGGSPCTYWSIAKSNRETRPDGEGGKLFLEYVRALNESKCRYFIFENNYSIHQNIKDFITEKLGVKPVMIDSALVSAQSRKRCYWTNIPFTMPEDKGIVLQSVLEYGSTERLKSKTVRCGGGESGWGDKHEWDMPNSTRRYTVTELERLQTLPDGYTKAVSDTQRRKLIGNGWTVDVIAHILEGIKSGGEHGV